MVELLPTPARTRQLPCDAGVISQLRLHGGKALRISGRVTKAVAKALLAEAADGIRIDERAKVVLVVLEDQGGA